MIWAFGRFANVYRFWHRICKNSFRHGEERIPRINLFAFPHDFFSSPCPRFACLWQFEFAEGEKVDFYENTLKQRVLFYKVYATAVAIMTVAIIIAAHMHPWPV